MDKLMNDNWNARNLHATRKTTTNFRWFETGVSVFKNGISKNINLVGNANDTMGKKDNQNLTPKIDKKFMINLMDT